MITVGNTKVQPCFKSGAYYGKFKISNPKLRTSGDPDKLDWIHISVIIATAIDMYLDGEA